MKARALKINVEYIKEKLKVISENAWDDEEAHGLQDQLLIEVLDAIAKGAPNPMVLAEEVLKVRSIKFNRWCGIKFNRWCG